MSKIIGRRRLRNLIRRLMKEDFYTNESPRISRAEIKIVEETLGTFLQIEHTHGAQPGPIAVYPVHEEEFAIKAEQFLNSEV